jgi:hypothetical protein
MLHSIAPDTIYQQKINSVNGLRETAILIVSYTPYLLRE